MEGEGASLLLFLISAFLMNRVYSVCTESKVQEGDLIRSSDFIPTRAKCGSVCVHNICARKHPHDYYYAEPWENSSLSA